MLKKIVVSALILVIAALPLIMAFSLVYGQTALTWKIETVDGGSIYEGTVGMWTSIALDSGGNPHIGYYSLQSHCVKYARWTGSAWNIETVDDTSSDVGEWLSLALDSGDNPHISYSEWTAITGEPEGNLKYARWTGSEWSIETVDSTGDTGFCTSLALDSGDNPHISYLFRGRTRDVKYARWTGSAWNIETVDSPGVYGGGGGEFTSIALDSGDNPHISYHAPPSEGEGGDLKYARWTGSEWSIETADSTSSTGWWTSLALDSGDNPHISHYDNVLCDLKYTWWTGSEWTTETVDSTGDVGVLPSLALDSGDNPHISYCDHTNFDLKYARWTGSEWSIETVDSTDLVGRWASIALDSGDNPHISYHDDTNGDLKYACSSLTAPVASFTESAHSVPVGVPINFDAAGSVDYDGTIVMYEWDWESDGVFDATGPVQSHAYSLPGTYVVSLRVTDNDGLTDVTSQTKTVTINQVIPEVPYGTAIVGSVMIIALLGYIALPKFRKKRSML